jgi:hypothetical protein
MTARPTDKQSRKPDLGQVLLLLKSSERPVAFTDLVDRLVGQFNCSKHAAADSIWILHAAGCLEWMPERPAGGRDLYSITTYGELIAGSASDDVLRPAPRKRLPPMAVLRWQDWIKAPEGLASALQRANNRAPALGTEEMVVRNEQGSATDETSVGTSSVETRAIGANHVAPLNADDLLPLVEEIERATVLDQLARLHRHGLTDSVTMLVWLKRASDAGFLSMPHFDLPELIGQQGSDSTLVCAKLVHLHVLRALIKNTLPHAEATELLSASQSSPAETNDDGTRNRGNKARRVTVAVAHLDPVSAMLSVELAGPPIQHEAGSDYDRLHQMAQNVLEAKEIEQLDLDLYKLVELAGERAAQGLGPLALSSDPGSETA